MMQESDAPLNFATESPHFSPRLLEYSKFTILGVGKVLFRGFHFCRNYVVALVGTFALLLGFERIPGLNPGYSALLVMPLLAVSVVEGKTFARASRVRPRNSAACLACLKMAVLSAIIVMLVWMAGQAWLPGLLAALGPLPFDSLTVTAIAFVMSAMLTLRLGFHFGVTSELQAQGVAAATNRDYIL